MKHKLKTFAFATLISIFSAGAAQAAYNEPYCREYNETFQIGGRTQHGYGTACLQPDGSWMKQEAAGSSYDLSYEQQKQNVVYIIDRQPVQIYRPYNNYYRPYAYSQPTNFFSISLGSNSYRSRPNYYHNNWGNDRWDGRGHGHGHGHGRGDRDNRAHRGWN
jgi:hypothetical protein